MFNSSTTSLPVEGHLNDHAENGHNSGVLSPIHYIIIVLIFYMGGLTILIIKYVQSENEEARYEQYYLEYVKRPQFDRPSLMKQIHDVNGDDIDGNLNATPLTKHSSFFHANNKSNLTSHVPNVSSNQVLFNTATCCQHYPEKQKLIVPYMHVVKSNDYPIVNTEIVESSRITHGPFNNKRISMKDNFEQYYLNMKQTNL